MNNNRLEQYFESARQLPPVLSYAQIESLVQVKGIINPPPKPFWWNLNFYLMILTATIVSLGLYFNPIERKEAQYKPEAIQATEIAPNKMERSQELALILEDNPVESNKPNSNPGHTSPMETVGYVEIEDDSAFEEEQRMALPDTFIASIKSIEMNLKESFPESTEEEPEQKMSSFDADKELVLEQYLDGVDWFDLQNSKADMQIHSWDKQTIKLIAKIKIETHKKEDQEAAVEDFELFFKQKGNHLGIASNWNDLLDCGCSIDKRKGKFKTERGENIAVSKLQIQYEVYLPDNIKLKLKNSYAQMLIPNWKAEMDLTSFKGEVHLGNSQADLRLSQNYGKANLGNFENLNLKAFKSEIKAGNGKKLSGKSNYSDLTVGTLENLNLATFKGDSEFKGVSQTVDVSVKYGDLKIDGSTASGEYVGFKAGLDLVEVKKAEVNLSYTRLKADKIGSLEIEKAFQSKLDLDQVAELQGDLKYSPLAIKNLDKSMSISSFKGSVEVEHVSKDFALLKAVSKYTDLEFAVDQAAAYTMLVETAYAGMTLPEQNMQLKFREDNQHNTKVEASVNGGEGSSKIDMNLFQGSLAFR